MRHTTRKPIEAARTRPIRTVHVTLTREGYEGSWVNMRSNAEYRTLDLLSDTDNVPAIREAIATLIVDHNLVDFDGQPLVVGLKAESLTNEELWHVLNRFYVAMREATELPKDATASSETTSTTAS